MTIASGGVAGVGHVSHIVGVSCGEGVRHREASSHLVWSVGGGTSLSLSLAVVVEARVVSVVSSVAQSPVASDQPVPVVNTRDEPSVGQTIGNLAEGVGVSLCLALH